MYFTFVSVKDPLGQNQACLDTRDLTLVASSTSLEEQKKERSDSHILQNHKGNIPWKEEHTLLVWTAVGSELVRLHHCFPRCHLGDSDTS